MRIPFSFTVALAIFLSAIDVSAALNNPTLIIDMTTEESSKFEVFYSHGSGFDSRQSKVVSIPGGSRERFEITLPANTANIRLDPVIHPSSFRFFDVSVITAQGKYYDLMDNFCLFPGNQIDIDSGKDGVYTSTGYDPQLYVEERCLESIFTTSSILSRAFSFSISFIAIVIVTFMLLRLTTGQYRILLGFVVGLVLFQVLMMGLFSGFNAHPDEAGHVMTSHYFIDEWYKLPVDDPKMLVSLLPGWATSYLYLNDIVYFLAEKFTTVWSSFLPEDYIRYRLFNFVLLAILTLIFLSSEKYGVYFLLCLSLTPQTWYLFSYFNGDAFSMFIALLLCYWFVINREHLSNYFWLRGKSDRIIYIFLFLSASLLFTRLHYSLILPYLLGLIFLFKPQTTTWSRAPKVITRLTLFAAIALVPLGLAELRINYINHFEKGSKITQIKEQLADASLKKSAILESRDNPHRMYLREMGVPYTDLFTKMGWHTTSASSFFGTYSYMTLWGAPIYYYLLAALGLGAVFVVMATYLVSQGILGRVIIGYFFLSVLAVVIQSSLYSWMYGFQPQGRYLLAIIPMTAATICSVLPANPPRIVYLYITAVFLVSSYGFTKYGLRPLLNLY